MIATCRWELGRMTTSLAEVVSISYEELLSPVPGPHLLALLGQAFGDSPSALGILAVSGVPNLPPLRAQLLPMARRLASLSSIELAALECPEADYQVGWSHGREKVEGGKYDTGKGSFFFNPLTDDLLRSVLDRRRTVPATVLPGDDALREVAEANPAFFAPNVWPENALLDLEALAKETGLLVCKVGRLVARLCDGYVEARCKGYPRGRLEDVLTQSFCCKARLLHYFPARDLPRESVAGLDQKDEDVADADYSSWCGWHNDHGSITGLLPAIYMNEEGEEVPCPDPNAGLYIKSRAGELVQVSVPADSLIFQVGETAQIHTGGILQATPHAVRGCSPGASNTNVSRETFAVFMEPEYHGDMSIPTGRTVDDTQKRETEKHLPKNVRVLRSRWRENMNFGEFSHATFKAFH